MAKSAQGKNGLCVCVPAFNAGRTIEEELQKLIELKKAGVIHSILVVNDGSRDKTREIIEKYSKEIEIIHFAKNKGKSAAVAAGIRWAKGKNAGVFGMLDADLKEIKSEQIEAMKKALGVKGVKMVVGNSLLKYRGAPWNATINSGQRLIRMNALEPFIRGNSRWTRLIGGEFKEKQRKITLAKTERAGYGLERALNYLFEGATRHIETNFKSAPASSTGNGLGIMQRGKEETRVLKLISERQEKLSQAREKRRRQLEKRLKRTARRTKR